MTRQEAIKEWWRLHLKCTDYSYGGRNEYTNYGSRRDQLAEEWGITLDEKKKAPYI